MKQYIEKAMTYADYIRLIDRLLIEGKTTGNNQSESMFGYGKLNRQRMQRLDKTIQLDPKIVGAVRSASRKMTWLIITEGWCGDAAQNIPVIEKIAAETDNIQTIYILRDENLELIDQFLTGGARSIPKLIGLDTQTLQLLGTWGARPAAAQQLYDELKRQKIEKPLIMEKLQRWYNADKNESIQSEFAGLLEEWDGKRAHAGI